MCSFALNRSFFPMQMKGMEGLIRVDRMRRGVILGGSGFSLFAAGMWQVDGVMAAMGLSVAALFWGFS